MALFNHLFPYTNLHDINLDWIISIIKSIDPAVIRALQELTPDIIAQVNQKVAEAQAAAIAAQSSASEANTARDEAAADAALANADAVRAEAAKTDVENSLVPVDSSITILTDIITTSLNTHTRTGKTAMITLAGQFVGEKSSEYYTAIGQLPVPTFNNNHYVHGWCRIISGGVDKWALCRVWGRDIFVESSCITKNDHFAIVGLVYPIN